MTYEAEDVYDDEGNQIDPRTGEPIRPPAEERTNAEWAALRREKKGKETEKARADALEKDLAFMRAGIDTSTNPMAGYFVKGYDGELTPEAIRSKAIEVGLLAETPPPEPDPIRQANLQAGERQSTIAQGGGSVTPVGTAALDEAFVQGGTDAMIQAAREMGIPIQNEQ